MSDINTLKEEVFDVLKDSLLLRDYSHFILKVVGGLNNCEIASVTKQSEANIRKRFKTINEELIANTAYIYEGEELIDTLDDGEVISTTAKYRNARRHLMNLGLEDE